MREALLIFRKDVRHLWPAILLLLAFTALEGWLSAVAPLGNPLQPVLTWLWPAVCVYLAASLVHEESLAGDNQYWLTRPYSRRRLFAAKVLLLVVFAGVPKAAAQAVAFAVNGVSPLRHIGTLLAGGAFAMTIALGGAALAAVTESLMQLVWVMLPIAGLEIAAVARAGSEFDLGNVSWIRNSLVGGVALAGAIAILAVQYGRRDAWLARSIAATVVLVAAAPIFGLWHAAFAIQSRLGRSIDSAAVRIAFDPLPRHASKYSAEFGPAVTGIDLPVSVDALPTGAMVMSERIAASIDGPLGEKWNSGWRATTGAIGSPNPLEDSRVMRSDGVYRLVIYVETAFYNRVKDAPVHVRARAALTLLGQRETATLAAHGRTRNLPEDGICAAGPGPFAGNFIVECAWPGTAPARAYVQASSSAAGQAVEGRLTPAGSYASFRTDGAAWSGAGTVVSVAPAPAEMKLETWQAMGHCERDVDIPRIRLADYALRRITDLN